MLDALRRDGRTLGHEEVGGLPGHEIARRRFRWGLLKSPRIVVQPRDRRHLEPTPGSFNRFFLLFTRS